MTAAELELERRWARPAGFAALLSAAMFIGAQFGLGNVLGSDDVEILRNVSEHSGQALALYLVGGLGAALAALPVLYLFRATRARAPTLPQGLLIALGVAVLLVVLAGVFTYLTRKTASDDFLKLSTAAQTEDAAEDAVADVGAVGFLGVGFGLAGSLGLGLVTFLTAREAMRAGLLTRFWGTFGMATGLVFVLIPYVLFGFTVYLASLFLRNPDRLPPAWEKGEAIPWAVPDRFKPRDERGVVEGDGTEIDVGPKETLEPELPESVADENGETQGQRRKKRKRRE